jgi:hypothetical protein
MTAAARSGAGCWFKVTAAEVNVTGLPVLR